MNMPIKPFNGGVGDGKSLPHAELVLNVGEIPASNNRLWLCGQITPSTEKLSNDNFTSWSQRNKLGKMPISAHLECRIGTQTLEKDISINEDGYFEAELETESSPPRRGWCVARNVVTFAEHTVEGCGVVLFPPANARQAAVVILPTECTLSENGLLDLPTAISAEWINQLLYQIRHMGNEAMPVTYVGVGPVGPTTRGQELALSINANGWPTGNIILVPTKGKNVIESLSHGLQQLRWVFARQLEFLVINLEKDLARVEDGAKDLATITEWINPGDAPMGMFEDNPPAEVDYPRFFVRPTRSSKLTRHPIVFCHGMLALSAMRMNLPKHLNSFVPLEPFLQKQGFRVLFPQVSPTSGVAVRAKELKEQILHWTDQPVNLIAHSMGGLDARYMISHLDMADHVTTLTTICTPHRGTFIAEWFIRNYRHRVPLLFALESLGANFDGFWDCQRPNCAEFNKTTPNADDVSYFSYGGEVTSSKISPILRRAWNILTPVEGGNDGLVSTTSAHWGEYLGTIPADHLAQTPDSMFLHPAETFDALGFYLDLVNNLARRGF